MRSESKLQRIVHILMKSEFYFSLSLRERNDVIRNILRKFPFSS